MAGIIAPVHRFCGATTNMPKSTYLANKILDHVYGGSDYVRPLTVYLALMTTAPTTAGGGTEVTGGGYARLAVTNNATNFPAASSGQKSNGTTLNWGTASAAWGTIVAVAIYDASPGGNLLGYGTLANSVTVNTGQPFSIAVGGAIFSET